MKLEHYLLGVAVACIPLMIIAPFPYWLFVGAGATFLCAMAYLTVVIKERK